MKTIIVAYSDKKELKESEIRGMKKYSFNTDSDIKVGDILDSKEYDTNMVVAKVLDKSYKYYNSKTGELSDEFTSTAQWEIRTLVVREDEETIVYASKIER